MGKDELGAGGAPSTATFNPIDNEAPRFVQADTGGQGKRSAVEAAGRAGREVTAARC